MASANNTKPVPFGRTERVNDLRVSLSTVMILARDGQPTRKLLESISKAAQHALDRDSERAAAPRARYSRADLLAKALEMRNAIDAIDLALHGENGILAAAKLFDDADAHLVINVQITTNNLRRIAAALEECNRIANSPEFIPANLKGS